jgi:hypothetical protein
MKSRKSPDIAALLLLLAFLCTVGREARADDVTDICAHDMVSGETYHGPAHNIDGAQLNLILQQQYYEPFQPYIVISTDEDNAIVLKMPNTFYAPGYTPTRGLDENGHAWQVLAYWPGGC